jgi:hypothetical protein
VIHSLAGDFLSSAVVSVISFLCLNFFFVPPIPSLRVSDPSDTLALISFLITGSVVAVNVARAGRGRLGETSPCGDDSTVRTGSTPTLVALLKAAATASSMICPLGWAQHPPWPWADQPRPQRRPRLQAGEIAERTVNAYRGFELVQRPGPQERCDLYRRDYIALLMGAACKPSLPAVYT